jgi:ATP-binding cassette, subfamily F, member 3
MRMLSGTEAPDQGTRTEGHNVVTQYFAQDEAARLDPALTVYQTLAGDSPLHMVPHIRTILGGFLFSGDDIEKPVRVLSGGERTRLAVARMLLRPANTLLLDEPTNHLDLDSKDVLLEALEDFGGTLMFVSHDRYFVDKLATKIIEIGGGTALLYPGRYDEFLWSRKNRDAVLDTQQATRVRPPAGAEPRKTTPPPATEPATSAPESPQPKAQRFNREEQAAARRAKKEADARRRRIEELESRIAEREEEIKALEGRMSSPGFYENHETSKPVIDRHQALMWEVGDLMNQWETLSTETKV